MKFIERENWLEVISTIFVPCPWYVDTNVFSTTSEILAPSGKISDLSFFNQKHRRSFLYIHSLVFAIDSFYKWIEIYIGNAHHTRGCNISLCKYLGSRRTYFVFYHAFPSHLFISSTPFEIIIVMYLNRKEHLNLTLEVPRYFPRSRRTF